MPLGRKTQLKTKCFTSDCVSYVTLQIIMYLNVDSNVKLNNCVTYRVCHCCKSSFNPSDINDIKRIKTSVLCINSTICFYKINSARQAGRRGVKMSLWSSLHFLN